MNKFFSVLAVSLLLMLPALKASAACSSYVGLATLNEFYKDRSNQAADVDDFLEVKILDNSILPAVYTGWEVEVCEQDAAGNNNDTDGCDSFSLGSFTEQTVPWLILSGTSVGGHMNFKSGFDAILRDGSGDTIDYFSMDGYTALEDAACTGASLPYDYEISKPGGGEKILQRSPDGTGDWSFTSSGSVDPTDDDTNDDVAVDVPSVSVSDEIVSPGDTATFTVSLDASYSQDVVLTYQTLDNSAQAGVDYTASSGNVTVSSGQTTATFSVPTLGAGAGNFLVTIGLESNLALAPNFPNATIADQTGIGTIVTLVGEWRMEEASWNGTADEVVDSSGNDLHGTAESNATTSDTTPDSAIAGSPGTCRYGEFDGADDVVEVADDSSLDFTSNLSMTAWVYPESSGGAGLGIIAGKGGLLDYRYRLRMSAGNTLEFAWCSNFFFIWCLSEQYVRTSTSLSLGTWSHVAVTFADGDQKLYVDGVQAATSSNTNLIDTNNASFNIGASTDFLWGVQYEFDGAIDELHVYDQPLTPVQINNIKDITRPCGGAGSIDHFEIDTGGASASTCAPQTIGITACADSSVPCGSIATDYTGTVDVSTSTNHGDWSVNSATNALNNSPDPADDDGTAQYSFDGADNGAISLNLTNTHADNLTITVDDGSVVSTSASIIFSDNTFVIRPDPDPAPAPDPVVVAGRDEAMTVTAWRRDTDLDPENCFEMTAYHGTNLPLKIWLTRDADDPGGAAPVIDGTSLPDAEPGGTNITLDFVNGVAPLVMSTSDVGKYVLELKDDSRVFATDTDIIGSSSSIVTRPFGFDIDFSNDRANNGTGGVSYAANLSGSAFAVAAEDFSATVTAVLWQGGDDADNNGEPDSGADLSDNGPTPSFGNEVGYAASVRLEPDAVVPVDGDDGALDAEIFTTFTGGASTHDMQWDNVGIINITASLDDNDYLGGGEGVSGTVENVGRFYPERFVLDTSSVTDSCDTAPNIFSYMDQPAIQIDYTLQAHNADGNVVSNYDDSSATPAENYSLAGDPSYEVENVSLGIDDGVDREARLSIIDDDPAPDNWVDGQYVITDSDATFGRQADTSPDGPFTDLRLGVSYSDVDATLANLDMNASTVGACAPASCTADTLGSLNMRYGRLRVSDAHGPESAPLDVPFQAEYWLNNFWALNTLDSCTTITRDQIAFGGLANTIDTPANLTVNVGGGSSTGSFGGAGNPNLDATDLSINMGSGQLQFSAPGAGNGGGFTVDVNLTNYPWLRFDWDQDGDFSDVTVPSATVSFGSYRGHDRIIYWREVLQ